jgi:hypothetical protein
LHNGQDEKQIRIVQLHEILNAESERPSYRKLLDRLSFFLSRENNDSCAIKLCYKLGKEEIVVGSSIELEYAIRCQCQCQSGHNNDVSMVAMSATVVQEGSKRATSPATERTLIMESAGTTLTSNSKSQIPANLAHYDRVQFPTVRFDTACALEGVTVSHQGRCITQIVERGVAPYIYKTVYAQEGFASGSHYWSYQVLDKACTISNIYIGVGSAKVNGPFPGIGNHPGCSLAVPSGQYWKANRAIVVPDVSLVNEATTIGLLLDMDHKTVTFYADGKRVGMGAGADVLDAAKYYPVVSFCHLGQSVVVEDIVNCPH